MILNVGEYRTRDGRKAHVLAVDLPPGPNGETATGIIYSASGKWSSILWTSNGSLYTSGVRTPSDLISPWRKPVTVAARIDKQSRSYIANLAHRPLERVEVIEGEVEQIDDAANKCIVRTKTGGRVEISYELTDREALLEAMQLRPVVRVRARGTILGDYYAKMQSLEELEVVDDVRVADVQKAWDHLASFREINNGWLDGEGLAVSEWANVIARGVLARLLVENNDLPNPSIYPTPVGGIQAEWALGRWMVDLTFPPDEASIKAEATHVDRGEERAASFEAGQLAVDNVVRLADWLKTLGADGDAST